MIRATLRMTLATALLVGAVVVHAFDLQGHRGARGLAPENSLAGFELAMRHGATTLELDIAITRDGVLVIHHDLALNPDLTRNADGRWLEAPSAPIHAMTWSELQAYDVGRIRPGSRYASQHPHQVPADGTRIPRLTDLFDLVKRSGQERMRFAIETKIDPRKPEATPSPEAFAKALVEEVRAAGLIDRVQILSFDWRSLQAVQRLAPQIPTVYLTAQQRWLDNVGDGRADSPWTAGFQLREHGSVPRMIKAAGGAVWSVHHADLQAERAREARQLGLKVLVWTVNDTDTMRRMIDLGVDGIVTDRPDLLRALLDERGITPR